MSCITWLFNPGCLSCDPYYARVVWCYQDGDIEAAGCPTKDDVWDARGLEFESPRHPDRVRRYYGVSFAGCKVEFLGPTLSNVLGTEYTDEEGMVATRAMFSAVAVRVTPPPSWGVPAELSPFVAASNRGPGGRPYCAPIPMSSPRPGYACWGPNNMIDTTKSLHLDGTVRIGNGRLGADFAVLTRTLNVDLMYVPSDPAFHPDGYVGRVGDEWVQNNDITHFVSAWFVWVRPGGPLIYDLQIILSEDDSPPPVFGSNFVTGVWNNRHSYCPVATPGPLFNATSYSPSPFMLVATQNDSYGGVNTITVTEGS